MPSISSAVPRVRQRMRSAIAASAVAATVALAACGGGNDDRADAAGTNGSAGQAVLKTPGRGLAKLGTLVGATVEVFDLHSDTPFHTTTSDERGQFKLDLGTRSIAELYRVQVRGGADVDFDDSGAAGQAPVSNTAVLTALATGRQIIENGVSVTVLSDALARRIGDNAGWNPTALVMRELDNAAQSLVASDINGDGVVDYLDILAFNPALAQHKANLSIDYADFFVKNPDGKSVMDLYHVNDPGLNDELEVILADAFDIRLPDADAATQAALNFGVEGHGSLQTASIPAGVDHDLGRYRQAVDKSTTTRIQVRATPDAGGKLLAWEGCEQDAADPLLCYVTPDASKSVLAIFKDVETVAASTSVVHLPAGGGAVGFVLRQDQAVITAMESDPVVSQLDAALTNLAANPGSQLFIGGDRAKQATLRITSVGTRTALDGVVRYALGYANATVTDAMETGSSYAPPAAISVDSIVSMNYTEDGSPATTILPQTDANADAVAGPNPVDAVIDAQLCGSGKTQHLLADGNVACIAPSNLPVQSETGLLHACAASESLVESLDGEEFCVAQTDLHRRDEVKAMSATVRSQGAGPVRAAAAVAAFSALQQPVQTSSAVPTFKQGQVAWLVGYGKAIYLAHNVFMIDRSDGRGITMVTVDGAVEAVAEASKGALAYQLCSKNLGAAECRFFGRTQASYIHKPADGRASQFELLPFPIVWEINPASAPWIKFKFKVNVDLTGTASADFDWGTLYYSFSSRGNFAITPSLNTTITADGLSVFAKPSADSPVTDRKEVSKSEKLKSGEPVFEKQFIALDFIQKIPATAAVSPVLESNLALSIGVDAAGQAKIDITTDYKQVVAWDVRSEFVYRAFKANINNQSFKVASKGFPGVTLKGDLNASVGIFAKAEVSLGVREIIGKLATIEAKYYPLKIDALGKVLLSYQTDPPKLAAQNGQSFCWAGAVSLTVRESFEVNAGYDFKPSNALLKKMLQYIELPKKQYPLYGIDRVKWTIGTNFGEFVKDPQTGASTEAEQNGEPVTTLQPDTKLACAAPTPAKMPAERTFAAGFLELDAGGSIFTKTHELTVQPDGNVVLYAWDGTRKGVVWAANTDGKGAYNRLKFQADGNLLVQDMFETVQFAANSYGVGAKSVRMAARGALEVVTVDGTVVWSSDRGINTALPTRRDFAPGALTLNKGDSVLTASRALVMQPDGNLVLYRVKDGRRDTPVWASNTRDGAKAVFQNDGNLVVYRADGSAAWASGTNGKNATRLWLQDNGTLVIYTNEASLWTRGA